MPGGETLIDRRLERFVQEQMVATRVPGLSLVVLRGGAVAERHFGFRDLRQRESPNSRTRYGIGSVTKVLTAVATLQLVDEGRVGLDDPIARHLPVEAAAFGSATVRHLLAHATGLPALGWSETKMSVAWFMDGYPVGDFADLATFMDGAEAWRTAESGQRWHYSNEGYIVLGRLLERIDGEPYGAALRRRVLEPLGMDRSTFDAKEVERDPDRVQPYMLDEQGAFVEGSNLHGGMPAAGGLVSTPYDMARLARFLLARGCVEGRIRLLSEASVVALAEAVVAIDPPTPFDALPLWADPPRVNGAGLQRHVGVFGRDVWAHGGGVMGGTAYLAVVPDEDLAVVILANAHGYPLAQLALVILAPLLGGDPEDLPFVRRQRLVERLAGAYASWSGTMRATLAPQPWGLELVIEFRPRARRVPLVLLDHDAGTTRFLSLSSGRPGIAEIHDDGSVPRLVFERYVFERKGEVLR
jgi:CubicO group peptidase (beta-lactamase class C family)